MSYVAVVPVRSLADGKQRLRRYVPDPWRPALILALLRRVARAAQDSGVLDAVAVISPDPTILRFAATLGLVPLCQSNTGLNGGLWQATIWARSRGADALLALHADLPLVRAIEIRQLVERVGDGPGLAIAGDRHGFGTNALLVRPIGGIPFRFGEHSFARHQDAARRRGLPIHALHSPALGCDLDTLGDLIWLAWRRPQAFVALWREVAALVPLARVLMQQIHQPIAPRVAREAQP